MAGDPRQLPGVRQGIARGRLKFDDLRRRLRNADRCRYRAPDSSRCATSSASVDDIHESASARSRAARAREGLEVQRSIAAPNAKAQLVVPRGLSRSVARKRVDSARPVRRARRRVHRGRWPRRRRLAHEREPADIVRRGFGIAAVANQRRDVLTERMLRRAAPLLRRRVEAMRPVSAEQRLQLRSLRRVRDGRRRGRGLRSHTGHRGAQHEQDRQRAMHHRERVSRPGTGFNRSRTRRL
jgi:hypothetical protein